ncbi:MAG: AMP-binding protein [Hydrogenophaga sp.]|nr:AMP-binding protein [Hydrogenophaga sp.]
MDAWLARLVGRDPLAPALSWRDPALNGSAWDTLSRADLAQQVTRCAHQLVEQHGLRSGQRVAWLGLNHPAMLVLLLALARCGGILVPLNHRLSPAEWQAVLTDCQPTWLVHDGTFAEAAQRLAERVPPLPLEALTAPGSEPWDERAMASRDGLAPLLLVYTSGTTGLPKAAVHTEANLLANIAIAAQVQGMDERDTVLTVLPLFHVGGLCIQTLPALSVGAHVRLFARFDATATLACFAHDRPTLTLQVPATLKALTEHAQWSATDLSSLRAVWAGSSLLPPAPLVGFHARGVPVCNVYGSTETGPFSIALPPEHSRSHAGSCGWPAPGVEVALRSPEGLATAVGDVGEICVRAPNVAQRYWPDQPSCDADGFFHSGDLARQAADGIPGRDRKPVAAAPAGARMQCGGTGRRALGRGGGGSGGAAGTRRR